MTPPPTPGYLSAMQAATEINQFFEQLKSCTNLYFIITVPVSFIKFYFIHLALGQILSTLFF
jgi:hypothetical protein